MKIHDFRLNYYIKHCAVILLTAWCFICLMEMPFNISCGINPVSDISSVSNISIAGHCAMVLLLFLILSVLMRTEYGFARTSYRRKRVSPEKKDKG